MMDLFAGYTITQRIKWLRRREEIREELQREFAELPLSAKEQPWQ